MICDGSRGFDERHSASMKHTSKEPVLEVAMALFGMVWLLRVRSEMRRCSKCRREEVLSAQQQAQQHHQQHHHHHHHQHHHHQRALSQGTLHTPDDEISSSANTLFTLDTPGSTGIAGSYCEVHGYVPQKEGTVNTNSNF